MKPRASAPRTTSGCLLRAQAASSWIVCRSASGSARSGMMSRKTTPGCGKSGTSRTFSLRETLTPMPDRAGRARRGAVRAPAVLATGRGRELLPNHAQRQELVALEAQDRLQPLDVLLAEEPVAALRAARRQQPLVLEVADLRDRDIREFGLQPCADGPDRQQARSGGCLGDGHFSRKVRRYLPIWRSSPSPSSPDSIRRRLRKVPFRLPRSSMKNEPSRRTSTACLRETVTSSRKMSQSGERPIVVRSPSGRNVSPVLPPPERTTSAGPLTPRSSSASATSSSPSSGRYVIVVSAPLSRTRSAPHFAQ